MPLDDTGFHYTAKQESLRVQLANNAAIRYFLARGGSRSGKTFVLCAIIALRAIKAPKSLHLILRKVTIDCKESIGGDSGTMAKVLELVFPGVPYNYHKQEGCFRFENGSEIWLGGLDSHNVEKILGKEYATIYMNEASELPYATFEMLKTRLAQVVDQLHGLGSLRQLFLVDLNPTNFSHWTYRLWFTGIEPVTEASVDLSNYDTIQMNPADNVENLSEEYLRELSAMSPKMRKRFFEGEYGADVEEALWRRSLIKRTQADMRDLARIVVAVDPAVSNTPGSDETGIIACGLDAQGRGYVLEDESGRMPAEQWARRAVALYHHLNADAIVAEVNQGGDLVENQIKAMVRADEVTPRVIKVHATRGKYVRAEPIAGFYERGLVFHRGEFPQLEDQMCSFTSDFDRKMQGYSPDRLDALVWGFTELFPKMVRKRRHNRNTVQARPMEVF